MSFFSWLHNLFAEHPKVATVTPIAVPNPALVPSPNAPVSSFPRLTWEKNHPERMAWSSYLINFVLSEIATFRTAKDIYTFRPDAHVLSDQQLALCIAQMFCSMAYYESSWDPSCADQDVGTSDKNTWSIGLLQLSVCDQENYGIQDGLTYEALLGVNANLELGVQIMCWQINKYGKIIMSDNENKYWATLCYGDKYDQSAQVIADVQAIKF